MNKLFPFKGCCTNVDTRYVCIDAYLLLMYTIKFPPHLHVIGLLCPLYGNHKSATIKITPRNAAFAAILKKTKALRLHHRAFYPHRYKEFY
jgi:hypothetical protein